MLGRITRHFTASAASSAPEGVVAVIGGGLAGLSAAIEAYEAGASVLLFDKAKNVGGNSAKATSGINGAETVVQRDQGVQDSVEVTFRGDVLKSGGGRSAVPLVETVVSKSADGVEWLMGERFNLSLTALAHCGGHSAARTHRIPPLPDGRPVPVGFTTVKAVQTYLASRPERVRIVTNAHVTQLLTREDGSVHGLRYTTTEHAAGGEPVSSESSSEASSIVDVEAGAVVLATGGYAFDRSEASLLRKYAPDKVHLATTSGPQATGDGVKLAEAAGAVLVDMDQIQVHPTGLVDPKDPTNLTKFLGPETMRGEGGILVNHNGKRFVNELATRAVVTKAIFDHGAKLESDREQAAVKEGALAPTVAYLIMNEAVADKFGRGMLGFYKAKGLAREAADAAAAAELIGASAEALAHTLQEYTAAAHSGTADEFGKVTFPMKDFATDEKVYVAIITPAIHYTMGGVAIDSRARVLRVQPGAERPSAVAPHAAAGNAAYVAHDSDVIGGLFAAGEVSGGVHGSNRLAGNSLLECVVMGRVAGREAAAAAAAHSAESASNSSLHAEL